MTRFFALISCALLLVGCRAPTPSMNVFAPYGSATVPPPGTGAIGGSGNYYAPPTPPANVPGQAVPSQPGVSPPVATPGYGAVTSPAATDASQLAMSGEPTPAVRPSTVAQASYQPGSTAAPSSTLRIKSMPVSDATATAEPQQFTPESAPINIADLPPAGANQVPSLLRILNSRSSTNEPTPATTTPPTPSTGTWTTR